MHAGQRRGRCSLRVPVSGGRTLLPHSRTGPDPGHPQIPLLGTEADTPLGGREGELRGFPRTLRTGRWEGPRSGTSERRAAPAWRTRGPAAVQGAPGQALPPSALLGALIHPPSRGPAGRAKNRLHGHPAARAGRPRPREPAPELRPPARARVGPGGPAEAEAAPRSRNPQADPQSGPAAARPGRTLQTATPGAEAYPENAPRARAHGSRRPPTPPHPRRPRSSPWCAAGNQAGTTRRRGLHSRLGALAPRPPPQ